MPTFSSPNDLNMLQDKVSEYTCQSTTDSLTQASSRVAILLERILDARHHQKAGQSTLWGPANLGREGHPRTMSNPYLFNHRQNKLRTSTFTSATRVEALNALATYLPLPAWRPEPACTASLSSLPCMNPWKKERARPFPRMKQRHAVPMPILHIS